MDPIWNRMVDSSNLDMVLLARLYDLWKVFVGFKFLKIVNFDQKNGSWSFCHVYQVVELLNEAG